MKLDHNSVGAIKNICCVIDEVTVDHNTVSRRFQSFHSICKDLNDQVVLVGLNRGFRGRAPNHRTKSPR